MSLTYPSFFSSRPTVVSSSETANSSWSHWTRSISRQRTTPSIAGIGPLSTIAFSARRRFALIAAGPFAQQILLGTVTIGAVVIEGPAPLVIAYAPVARLALTRFVGGRV